jgi:hypothetical protein
MRTKLPDDLFSCIPTQGKHTDSCQRHDERMNTAWRFPEITYDLVLNVCFVNFTGRAIQ